MPDNRNLGLIEFIELSRRTLRNGRRPRGRDNRFYVYESFRFVYQVDPGTRRVVVFDIAAGDVVSNALGTLNKAVDALPVRPPNGLRHGRATRRIRPG